MNEVLNEPNVSIFLESLRSIGYSFSTAVADIVDNSIAANATKITIEGLPTHGTGPYLAILDNGCGMSPEELRQAMKYGSESCLRERKKNDLGRFGLGLKSSSFSQCRKVTVLSKKDGILTCHEWDLDLIQERNKWFMRNFSLDEVASLPLAKELESLPHGTLVLWRNIDMLSKKERAKSDREFFNAVYALRTSLGRTYHRFINANPSLIITVNGNPVSDWYDVTSAMKAVNDPEMVVAGNVAVQSVSLSILRAGSPLEMSVTPELISVGSDSSEKRLMIGMVAKVEPIPELEHTVQYGPVDAMIKSLALTGETSLVLLNAFKDMIIGALSVKNLSGPIAIAEVAGASASWGVIPFLWFLATISINLAVFNLIPIPVLDGGQLLYCLYEKLAGHKPSARVQFYLTAFGLSILLSLTFLAIFNDLMRVL